jgi:hypothetical protein
MAREREGRAHTSRRAVTKETKNFNVKEKKSFNVKEKERESQR